MSNLFKLGVQELEKNNVLKAIDIILESLRLYTLVLNKKNSKISKCEDSLAKCFAIVGNIIVINSYMKFSCNFSFIIKLLGIHFMFFSICL